MDNGNNSIIKTEQEILKQEKHILAEIKQEEKMIRRLGRNIWIVTGLSVFIIVAVFGGILYWNAVSSRIYVEKAEIAAPLVELAAQNTGVLQQIFVKEGDLVQANTAVARVENELVKTKVDGVVVSVKNDVGKIFNRGEAIITMVDPRELRVEARIEEDKGLKDVKIGQRALFTVDAFGSKNYEGIVDEISPTSRQSGIVFNISDKREVKEFVVKARFNQDLYPELKNGMSAKIWIYR